MSLSSGHLGCGRQGGWPCVDRDQTDFAGEKSRPSYDYSNQQDPCRGQGHIEQLSPTYVDQKCVFGAAVARSVYNLHYVIECRITIFSEYTALPLLLKYFGGLRENGYSPFRLGQYNDPVAECIRPARVNVG